MEKTARLIGATPACSQLSKKEALSYIHLGTKRFRHELAEKGERNACISMDAFMRAIDEGVSL